MGLANSEKLTDIGIALYTVRDSLQKDFGGTLKALRKIGFDYCEPFGLSGDKMLGMGISEVKSAFKKAKLPIKSIHTSRQAMLSNWQQTVDNAADLGAEYIILAYLTEDERQSIDQYKALIDLINKCAETSWNSGVKFLYHNHDFEFKPINGQVPYDLLLGQTNSAYVNMELDLYWVRYADQDPLKLFRENRNRFPLWHIKDMELKETRLMTEVGAGRIDWKQLFARAQEAGMKGLYVEQDRNWAVDPIASTATSYKYLKRLRY